MHRALLITLVLLACCKETSGDAADSSSGDDDSGLPGCGNGVIDSGEVCDGLTVSVSIQGVYCESLGQGFVAGKVAQCLPSCLEYDVSSCVSAPAPPEDAQVTVLSARVARLSWTSPAAAPARPWDGVAIFRRGPQGVWHVVGSTPLDATSFVDDGLQPSTSYSYKLASYVDHAAVFASPSDPILSVFSDERAAETPGAMAPPAPTDLQAEATGAFGVQLGWTADTGADGFIIERSAGGSSFVEIGRTVADALVFVDTLAEAGVALEYRVASFTAQGVSSAATSSELQLAAPSSSTQNGSIATDAVWTVEGGPYLITTSPWPGGLVIGDGVALTIEPGAELRFDDGAGIEVRGALVALGSVDLPIVFTSSHPLSAAPGAWHGITLQGGQATFRYVQATFAANGLPGEVLDSRFASNQVAAAGLVTRSTFMGNGVGVAGADALFSTFIANEVGVEGDATYSVLVGNATGVEAQARFSYISGGDVGARRAFRSTFSDVGVVGRGPFEGCNFLGPATYALEVTSSSSVDAENNWWGTTDAALIAASIRDFVDDPSLGTADFEPSLMGPIDSLP